MNECYNDGKTTKLKFGVLRKNKKSEYNSDSIALKFNNPVVSKKLVTWVRTRDLIQKTMDARDEFDTEKVSDMGGTKSVKIKQYLWMIVRLRKRKCKLHYKINKPYAKKEVK